MLVLYSGFVLNEVLQSLELRGRIDSMCSRRQTKGRSSLLLHSHIARPKCCANEGKPENNVLGLLFLLIVFAVEHIFSLHLTNKLL